MVANAQAMDNVASRQEDHGESVCNQVELIGIPESLFAALNAEA